MLPVLVYYYDNGEFDIHFQASISQLLFITNRDILLASVSVFTLSSLILIFQNRRKVNSLLTWIERMILV